MPTGYLGDSTVFLWNWKDLEMASSHMQIEHEKESWLLFWEFYVKDIYDIPPWWDKETLDQR